MVPSSLIPLSRVSTDSIFRTDAEGHKGKHSGISICAGLETTLAYGSVSALEDASALGLHDQFRSCAPGGLHSDRWYRGF